ncbi:MAG: hypothetical protein M1821_008353 [Bathelium mastoideum]|nr:MAG: hypothetical protein M1821_008353 [Bathelium mastoideum]
MAFSLPSQHHALMLENHETGFELKTLPTPQPVHGSAVVRIAAVGVLSYSREIYNGERQYSYPKPLIGGHSAIGHIAALGPDAAALRIGKLVFVDCVVRGRDEPSALFLSAINEGSSEGSRKLMRDVWRDGTFAEFARVPLENCIPLNEARLCRELGYSVPDLMYMSRLLVPYGGLRDIRLEPGETIVVCPATGCFGAAGVQVATAMGAKVIAMGRDEVRLARLKDQVEKSTPGANIETVKLTGDDETDTAALQAFGTIDAVLDFSPPAAARSTHLKSAVRALRYNGRCSLMGLAEDCIPAWKVIGSNILLKGKLMYEREDMIQFVKMLEKGLFPIKGFVNTKVFGLADWDKAFDTAAEYVGINQSVVIVP